jgi:hypothetical protein
MTTTRTPITDKSRARLVGTLFLAAILAYGIGTSLITSISATSVLSAPDTLSEVAANTAQFTLGVALMLANSVIVAAIGVLLFPILKRHSTPVARVYLAGRLVEAVVLIVGIGFLFFCTLLFRTRLVPRFLAVWGVVGYAVFFAGAVLELVGPVAAR